MVGAWVLYLNRASRRVARSARGRSARLHTVERAIVEFTQDDLGDWVALLQCGHRQHVRHKPPFLERPWVLQAESRQGWIGRPLNCRLCDQEADCTDIAGDSCDEEGGDAPCLAGVVCPECGAVTDGPGAGHRPGCREA